MKEVPSAARPPGNTSSEGTGQRRRKGARFSDHSSFLLLPASFVLCWFGNLAQSVNVIWFVASGLLAGAAFLVALRGQISPARLWLVALAARLLLLPAEPGDDLWRYIWEGRVQAAGFNPYVLAPIAPELTPLRDGSWAKIDHKSFAAAYPPGAELAFRLLAPLPPLGWKLIFLLADLGVVALLWAWRRDDVRVAAAYAWNPLILYSFAAGAHFDSLMVLALVGSALLLQRSERPLHAASSALLLGLAIALKVIPLVLLPVWAFALGWRRMPWLLLALLPPLAGALHFGWPAVDITAGLREFGRIARTNDCVWWLVEFLRGERLAYNDLPQLVQALACGLCAWVFRRDWPRATLWVLGALLIFSPALHPWYLSWILPFAALAAFPSSQAATSSPSPASAWFVFSVSVFGYFLLWLQPLPWQQPVWLRLLILLPPLLWLLLLRGQPRATSPPGAPKP